VLWRTRTRSRSGLGGQPALRRRAQLVPLRSRFRHGAELTAGCRQSCRHLPAGDVQNRAMTTIAMQWASTDPKSAVAWVAGFPEGSARDGALSSIASQWRTTSAGAASGFRLYRRTSRGIGPSSPTSVNSALNSRRWPRRGPWRSAMKTNGTRHRKPRAPMVAMGSKSRRRLVGANRFAGRPQTTRAPAFTDNFPTRTIIYNGPLPRERCFLREYSLVLDAPFQNGCGDDPPARPMSRPDGNDQWPLPPTGFSSAGYTRRDSACGLHCGKPGAVSVRARDMILDQIKATTFTSRRRIAPPNRVS